MPSTKFRGCGRGIFALQSWNYPLRRPACLQQADNESTDFRPGQTLMMKYTFNGNPDSPLGKELTLKPKAVVTFVSRYDEHWIMVRSEAGEEGYVPSNYVMVTSETVNSLPWLDQTANEQNRTQQAAEWKPYKSAYAPKSSSRADDDSTANQSEYYCKVCEKQLNGPIPYQAHVASKAHREEVEAQAEYS